MCTASVQIIIESSEILAQDIQYFQNQYNGTSTKTLHDIDMLMKVSGFQIIEKFPAAFQATF